MMHMFVIPAAGRLRQEEHHKFKASLGYIASLSLTYKKKKRVESATLLADETNIKTKAISDRSPHNEHLAQRDVTIINYDHQ